MGEESEKRFEALMTKLFNSPPKSKPNASNSGGPFISHGGQNLRGRKRKDISSLAGMGLNGNVGDESGSSLSSSTISAPAPLCRPWNRDDLFRRLSTFKSMTWFAKPQVVSPLECARKGWVNVDMDTITCESCGARLFFSTPSTWTLEQVEKAAMVFSLKLESGHKVLCPWINNACNEELAQFPNLSAAALIEDYQKRLFALSQLTALPIISLISVDNMRSTELEQYLRDSASGCHGYSGKCRKVTPEDVPESVSSVSYYQALKLISLCGWEPYTLPYIVELKDRQDRSIIDASVAVKNGHKQKVDVYSLCVNEGTKGLGQQQFDPGSVVLECKLCGACVGLWAFSTVSRPMEYLRFVGLTEVNCEGRAHKGSSGNDIQTASEGVKETNKTGATSIAGGPCPATLNYDATISLPVFGESLRARFLIGSTPKNQLASPRLLQVERERPMSTENLTNERTFATYPPDLDSTNPLKIPHTVAEILSSTPEDNTGVSDGGSEPYPKEMVETDNSKQGSFRSYSPDKSVAGPSTKHKSLPFSSKEDDKLPSVPKSVEIDPLKQHRHFCSWITSTGKHAPGWKETLSALNSHNDSSLSLDNMFSSLIEVNDPVASVEKLIHEERRKVAGGS